MPANSKLLVGDQFNRPAPQYFNPTTDQYEYLYGSDGALHVKLVSGGVAVAAELTSSQKEAVARAIDGIIDTIGLENIACFLPMWENTGAELRDLINPGLRFRVVGATPGVAGPFGYGWSLDGINDYIQEAPAVETAGGTGEAFLDGPGKMLAQRIKFRSLYHPVAFIMLHLKRTGSPSGNLILEIREDDGGVPAPSPLATSFTYYTADFVKTFYGIPLGFPFHPPFSPSINKTYWIVLRFADGGTVTVDPANHIAWQCDTSGLYGEPRAVFGGSSWSVQTGQNHTFSIYYNHLRLNEGSWFIAIKPLINTPYYYRSVFSQWSGQNNREGGFFMEIQDYSLKPYTLFCDQFGIVEFNYDIFYDRFIVVTPRFSKDDSIGKISVYINGKKMAAINGGAGQEKSPSAMPFTLGLNYGTHEIYAPFLGHIGGLIIARTPLTDQQIARVTSHILTLRKYGVPGI